MLLVVPNNPLLVVSALTSLVVSALTSLRPQPFLAEAVLERADCAVSLLAKECVSVLVELDLTIVAQADRGRRIYSLSHIYTSTGLVADIYLYRPFPHQK